MQTYLSNLRNLSTFAVVLLHVAGLFVVKFGNISRLDWQIANTIDSFTRFCVPVFLMITGAVMLGKDENIHTFISRRFRRVVVPFLCWNVIYFIFLQVRPGKSLDDLGRAFLSAVETGSSPHFWYIYVIIGIYLFIPVLRKWSVIAPEKEVRYFLVIWLITLFPPAWLPNLELIYFSRYLGYVVLGYYLHTFVKARNFKILSLVIFLTGAVFTALITNHLSLQKNQPQLEFYEYLTPNVCLMATGFFMMVKNSNLRLISAKADSLSYGIYLVHILVLQILLHFFKPFKIALLAEIVLLTLLTYAISFIIVFVLQKIKPFKSLLV